MTQVQIDADGAEVAGTQEVIAGEEPPEEETQGAGVPTGLDSVSGDEDRPRPKYYVDEGYVEIVAHLVYELDHEGKQLRVVKYIDYAGSTVRTLYANAAALRREWADPELRAAIIERLAERGIDFDYLREAAGQPEADPFDLLCYLAFNSPIRTRRERADQVRQTQPDFFAEYGPGARAILNDLLDKYADHGLTQFQIPEVLKVPPISNRGNVSEIAQAFGGPAPLRRAVTRLQTLLYAA
jgi:type I restriction enzyme R subunit